MVTSCKGASPCLSVVVAVTHPVTGSEDDNTRKSSHHIFLSLLFLLLALLHIRCCWTCSITIAWEREIERAPMPNRSRELLRPNHPSKERKNCALLTLSPKVNNDNNHAIEESMEIRTVEACHCSTISSQPHLCRRVRSFKPRLLCYTYFCEMCIKVQVQSASDDKISIESPLDVSNSSNFLRKKLAMQWRKRRVEQLNNEHVGCGGIGCFDTATNVN